MASPCLPATFQTMMLLVRQWVGWPVSRSLLHKRFLRFFYGKRSSLSPVEKKTFWSERGQPNSIPLFSDLHPKTASYSLPICTPALYHIKSLFRSLASGVLHLYLNYSAPIKALCLWVPVLRFSLLRALYHPAPVLRPFLLKHCIYVLLWSRLIPAQHKTLNPRSRIW